MADTFQRRRRVAGATVLALGAVVVLAVASPFGGSRDDAAGDRAADARRRLPELPGGGRRILPGRRVVGLYGHPTDEELGALGIGPPAQAARRMLRQARAYERPDRPVLPAMELLASIATTDPGAEGDHSLRTDDATIARYLRAARSAGAILVLDVQPGHAGFLEETRRLQRWLKKPDVSLALDPEWKVPAGTVPGDAIGATTAAEINEVSWFVDMLTRVNRLPQKLLLVHQFTDEMIADEHAIEPREWVAVALNVDGFGTPEAKAAKYDELARDLPWAAKGFKLFYREDEGLMTPREVMRLQPSPSIVMYE